MTNTRLVPIALVAAVALAACGGDDDDATDATVPVTAPTLATGPTEPAPATTVAATTPASAAPTSAAPAPTDPVATSAATSDAPATSAVPTEPAAPVEPIRVTAPGAVEVTNPTVAPLLASLAEATGNTAGPEALIGEFGLNTVPHIIVENGSLFEVSGAFDATFPDRPEYSLDQSYVVQFDAPDPAALLTAVGDAIAATGAYDVETGSRTDDGLTLHYLDLSGTNFEEGLPRWTLLAAHLGETTPGWEGIVELQIESYGNLAAATTIPPALTELDGTARSEAPAELTPYRYTFKNGLNMFGGFPVRSAEVYYHVAGGSDLATAIPEFDAALSPIYGEGMIEEDYASWSSDPYSWSLRLDFEDKLIAQFGSSEF